MEKKRKTKKNPEWVAISFSNKEWSGSQVFDSFLVVLKCIKMDLKSSTGLVRRKIAEA